MLTIGLDGWDPGLVGMVNI